MTSAEYRKWAGACLLLAEEVASVEERAFLAKMASDWYVLALERESKEQSAERSAA
jgi:hypothetical protein